jgi:sugar/nucleoside kinase (ribokinase family)
MKKYDVVGIGNSLLDFTFNVDDSLLTELGLNKGEMVLIDKEKSRQIFDKLMDYNHLVSPGGSCSNTIAGIGLLGGKVAFLGKLGKDENAEIYEKQTSEFGVISSFKKHDNEITGHAITFITPDKERTFATHLGASVHFSKEDVLEDIIKDAKILHLEGYTLEAPLLKSATLHAIDIAKKNNVRLSIDLSDSGLINRNLDFIKTLLKQDFDIVFVNEKEAESLTKKTPNNAVNELGGLCEIAVVKLGKEGSLIKNRGSLYKIPAYKVEVINTNGAGDMFAAGFLFGLSKNLDIVTSGKLASYLASLVVNCPGARLDKKNRLNIDSILKKL